MLFATMLLVAFIIVGCTSSALQDYTPPNSTEPIELSISDDPTTVDDPLTSDEIFTQENDENEEHTTDIDERLLGIWETASGVPLWFFCSPTIIEFFPDGRVHETCCDKYATIDFHGDGRFTLIGESGHADTGGIVEGPFIFTYSFSGGQLTLIDQDGDSATYNRK